MKWAAEVCYRYSHMKTTRVFTYETKPTQGMIQLDMDKVATEHGAFCRVQWVRRRQLTPWVPMEWYDGKRKAEGKKETAAQG